MVQELRRVITRQGSYRFYSSSLLIIYDGDVIPELASNGRAGLSRDLKPNTGQEDVQNRDSRCVLEDKRRERETKTECNPSDSTGPDHKEENVSAHEAAAFPTARTMPELLHTNPTAPAHIHHQSKYDCVQVKHSHHQGTVSESSGTFTDLSSTTELDRHSHGAPSQHNAAMVTQEPQLLSSEQEARHLTPNKLRNGYHRHNHRQHHVHRDNDDTGGKIDLEMARKSVDLRMIDFAHSTHSGYNDEVRYRGPDDGYVTGVTSLVNCLERMLESM